MQSLQQKPSFNIFEVGVAFVCVWMAGTVATESLSLAFSGFWTAICLVCFWVALAILAVVRSMVPAAFFFGLIAAVIAAVNLPTIPEMFPLSSVPVAACPPVRQKHAWASNPWDLEFVLPYEPHHSPLRSPQE